MSSTGCSRVARWPRRRVWKASKPMSRRCSTLRCRADEHRPSRRVSGGGRRDRRDDGLDPGHEFRLRIGHEQCGADLGEPGRIGDPPEQRPHPHRRILSGLCRDLPQQERALLIEPLRRSLLAAAPPPHPRHGPRRTTHAWPAACSHLSSTESTSLPHPQPPVCGRQRSATFGKGAAPVGRGNPGRAAQRDALLGFIARFAVPWFHGPTVSVGRIPAGPIPSRPRGSPLAGGVTHLAPRIDSPLRWSHK